MARTQSQASRPRSPSPATNSQAVDLVMELLAIPGGSGNETEVAVRVREKLLAAGVPASAMELDGANRRSPLRGAIGNLIVKLPGTLKRPRRLLMAHLDTVPICLGAKPIRRGEWIRSADATTGLGGDDRAGVAVILRTALDILERKLPHPPLTFLFTVQEETGLHGARHVNLRSLGGPRLAFNWDGGAPEKITIGATGGYRLSIDVRGRASHAGVAPEQGISAIAIASLAISDLVENGWHGLIERKKPTGVGTSNIGVIHGGDATNVVTEHVQLRAEARSHDPRFRDKIVQEIERAFRRAAQKVKSADGAHGEVEFDGRLDYESFLLATDEPCVVEAEAAVHAIGLTPFRAVAKGGLDANWLSAHGIPTVTLGCGQADIHTASERLNVPEFERACQIALLLATDGGK